MASQSYIPWIAGVGALYIFSRSRKEKKKKEDMGLGDIDNYRAREGQEHLRERNPINDVSSFPLGRSENQFILADIRDPIEREIILANHVQYLRDTEGGTEALPSKRLYGDRVKGPERGHIFFFSPQLDS